MKFCPNCGRVMVRNTLSGFVVFSCPCGVEEKGTAADACVIKVSLDVQETTDMYHNLILRAPFDRTNQLVERICPKCGLNYMVQIRVGDAEVIIYKCKCGFKEIGGVK